MSQLPGREFFKMSGSGNDFVLFASLEGSLGPLAAPEAVRAICARRTGVGADGVVFLLASPRSAFRMIYFNSDGSRAELCGNAALCSARLAVHLGFAPAGGFEFESDAGLIRSRIRVEGTPEIDLQPVGAARRDAGIRTGVGERRVGFAQVGVPHLVVLCDDATELDVEGRGAELRHHQSMPQGANVNFISKLDERWAMRTFERGVEGETLACGSGAVASALLLRLWGLETREDSIFATRSNCHLRVRLSADGSSWRPSLSGEGRIVYEGRLREVPPAGEKQE